MKKLLALLLALVMVLGLAACGSGPPPPPTMLPLLTMLRPLLLPRLSWSLSR